MTPFSSIRQRRLGASLAIVFRNSRSRSRAAASSWRSVMSMPPAMIPPSRPCSSGSGAERQKTTRFSPRRLTNVFSYSTAGCSGAAASKRADHVCALRLVDEDVPELAAADRLLVVLAGCLDRGGVLVDDPPVGVEVDEQARCGVDERDEEAELRAELGLEPHVLERQPDRRRDEIDRVGLLGERRIVDERGHPPSAALDRRHGALRRRCRLVDVPAVARRPSPRGRRGGRRSRATGRAARRRRASRSGTPASSERSIRAARGAVEAAAEHAGEERQRHERERDQEEHPDDRVRACSRRWSTTTETSSSATAMPQER